MRIIYLSSSPNSRGGSFLVVGGGPFYNLPSTIYKPRSQYRNWSLGSRIWIFSLLLEHNVHDSKRSIAYILLRRTNSVEIG